MPFEQVPDMAFTKPGLLNQLQKVVTVKLLNYIGFKALSKYLIKLRDVDAGTAEYLAESEQGIKADLVYQLVKRLHNTFRAAFGRFLKYFFLQAGTSFLICGCMFVYCLL